ncbi:hypothetical protein Barb6_01598 [Bacteroidales bacterium Barb6]|nr:hypothetical protein Barb6_01598 [Bacteroidales bacterium Barb6]
MKTGQEVSIPVMAIGCSSDHPPVLRFVFNARFAFLRFIVFEHRHSRFKGCREVLRRVLHSFSGSVFSHNNVRQPAEPAFDTPMRADKRIEKPILPVLLDDI